MARDGWNAALMGLAMMGTACLALMAAPVAREGANRAAIPLENIFPVVIGDWKVDPNAQALVRPAIERGRDFNIYQQVLERTYVDRTGRRIMLSVAYGTNQSPSMQMHRPEICYQASGYEVTGLQHSILELTGRGLPATRLLARQEGRSEPITYWMRIGNDVSEGVLERQWLKLAYGLRGLIPDGALFRVSTIGVSEGEAFEIQQRFIRDLLKNAGPQLRTFFVGVPERGFIAR